MLEYKKKVEVGLRTFCSTASCRRVAADAYFENPPTDTQRESISVWQHRSTHEVLGSSQFPCCDNCTKAKQAQGVPLTLREQEVLDLVAQIEQCNVAVAEESDSDEEPALDDAERHDDERTDDEIDAAQEASLDTTSSAANAPGKRQRKGKQLADCRAKLETWRRQCFRENFRQCIFGEETVLPSKVLTRLASRTTLKTPEDVVKACPDWIFAEQYAAHILKMHEEVDQPYLEATLNERRTKQKEKGKLTAICVGDADRPH